MRQIFYSFLFLVSLFCLSACDTAAESPEVIKADAASEKLITDEQARFDSIANKAKTAGLLGVFDVPEMLAMVKMDSAKAEEVAAKRAACYTTIESEINSVGAEMEGSPGSIYYSNDPANFKFECVIMIREMPKLKPEKCNIVVLEASKMLIHNYFGDYQDLHKAYNEMRLYCQNNKLEQSGPMREFYIINPTNTSDPTKWLTRIMVPVMDKK